MNSNYFTQVGLEPFDETTDCKVYQCKKSPMVLMSLVDGSPLASLHLECQYTAKQEDSNNTRGKALITHRPDRESETPDLQQFQGMIDRDDQEFQLVITNLSTSGYINFNILKTDSKVQEVNPMGLNKVNELRANESYCIKADQATNLALLLSTLKDAENKPTGVTVKKDEDVSNKDKKGTYYFLSIVPQLGHKDLETRFAQTKWVSTDLIVRKEQRLANPYHYSNMYRQEHYQSMMDTTPRAGGVIDRRMSDSRTTSGLKSMFGGLRRAIGSFGHSTSLMRDEEDGSMNDDLSDEVNEVNEVNVLLGDDLSGPYPQSLVLPSSVGVSTVSSTLKNCSYDLKATPKTPIATPFVDNSLAAQVKGGRHVDVFSAETGIEYNYELSSARCVLGLSVSLELKFDELQAIPNVVDEVKLILDNIKSGKYTEMLKGLNIFATDECVVTLEGKPDIVFYTCGHCCVKKEVADKISKCPMCRKLVIAKIPREVEVLVVDEVKPKEVLASAT